VVTYEGEALAQRLARSTAEELAPPHPAQSLRWLRILQRGLAHHPVLIEALVEERSVGRLALARVESWLFGRMLVSLPYVNLAGVQVASAGEERVPAALVDEAVRLAQAWDVRYLELRQTRPTAHPALTEASTAKVRMVRALPATPEALWDSFKSKLRSQIRSGQKRGLEVAWGGEALVDAFYAVFARNMRDLGTPVYPRRLFLAILDEMAGDAELCVVRAGRRAVAAGLLVHGRGISEVPSASSLRAYNHTSANMVLYWNLLSRAIERGQHTFDFGRSSVGSSTYRFKEQWGAVPEPSVWQYHVRRGSCHDLRPDQPRFGLAIRVWRKLPVWLTRWLGPVIVRGIP
jgi:FemAB-related protein (PEP-CTERM system-associated)